MQARDHVGQAFIVFDQMAEARCSGDDALHDPAPRRLTDGLSGVAALGGGARALRADHPLYGVEELAQLVVPLRAFAHQH
jgi:hypothetical protein